MKFSEMWLREWITPNPPINNAELTNQLTMVGLKVDESNIIANAFYGVTISEIIEYQTHPNCHNMWILTINNGSKTPLNIICNNTIKFKKHYRVVVANIGSLLPNGTTVTPTIIHGQISEGILCSFTTLGLEIIDDTKNIIELPPNVPIGQEFYDYLSLNDNILNISITPNRGDCLSILGVAREIATINHLTLKTIKKDIIIPTIHDTISINIETPEACPLFFGRILKNIDITISTPLWIKEKLRRCGINSINIIVDIANYVLLELGHPIYIFDYKKIHGNTIYTRFSKNEEVFDDNNHYLKLLPKTLIITDCKKTLSIVGITENQSTIHSNTRDIILQSAFFNPSIIKIQSKLYNIHTLSSFRYERGVDPNISETALNYTTSLLLKICGGQPGPITNATITHTLPKPIHITLYRANLDKILGFHIIDSDIIYILTSLGFQIECLRNCWKILIPTWRFDISIEENLIAEIIRIYGYNKIPDTTTHIPLKIPDYSTPLNIQTPLSRIKNLLINRGYQEIITYSFVNPNIQTLLYPNTHALTLKNPMTLEMSVMRLSLWTGLIETVIFNQNRQQKHIQLFESGICFIPNNIHQYDQINQNFMIAGIRSGFRHNKYWDSPIYPVDFYDIKGDIESLLNITNHLNNIKFKPCEHTALHPGQSAAIYLNDTLIGYMGMIHPTINMQLNLRTYILVFELLWNPISKSTSTKITNISKFPKNYRDISVILPDKITAASVIDACKSINHDCLINVKLSDVYKTGNNIPKGFKSFTIKLILQSNTHTLKEIEISNIINQCVKILNKRFHAILR